MSHFLPDPTLPLDVAGWDRLRRPIWLFDPETCRGLYANPSALELWSAESLGELLSRDFSRLSPAVRTRTERLARATADGRSVTERWTFYPQGKPVTVNAVISTFAMDDGRNVLLFEAAPVDVEQDERRAVEALRHTSSQITLFGPEGRSVFSNPAAFAAYGEDERSFADRFADREEGEGAWARILAGEVLAEFRLVQTREGERWHHMDARSVTDPVSGQTVVLVSERDVTAQVEAERELVAATERADVAEAKERFLANMSHELRTPLNAVIGFAGVLAQGELDEAQREHVGRISDAGEGLLEIINDVISLSELDQGEVSLDIEPFNPALMLRKVADRYAEEAGRRGLECCLELPDDLPQEVAGDAARLRKIAQVYMSNAVKFTEAGAITLGLSMRGFGDGSAEFEFYVSDTGPGIPAETQARLFQRFTPGDDSRGKRASGTGLGLAIARELATLMGGEVGVETTPGAGSRFWCRVVLEITDADARGEADAAEGPFCVLYADDNESNRVLVQTLLAVQGHRCDVVCDGLEAVEAVRDGDYDLVLMDIQMPNKDGIGATVDIRALPGARGRLPIIALTANTLSEQLDSYAAAGMNDCIAKPVKPIELLEKTAVWGAVGAQGNVDEVAA